LIAGINLATLRQSQSAQKLLTQLSGLLQIDTSQFSGSLAQIGEVDQVWFSVRSGEMLALVQGRLRVPDGFVSLGNGMTSWRFPIMPLYSARKLQWPAQSVGWRLP